MEDTSGGDWRSLCELAKKEQDPQKLLELITEINRALAEYRRRSGTNEASFRVHTVLVATSKNSQSDFDFYRFPGRVSNRR